LYKIQSKGASGLLNLKPIVALELKPVGLTGAAKPRMFYDSKERARAVAAGTVEGGAASPAHAPKLLGGTTGDASASDNDAQAQAFMQVSEWSCLSTARGTPLLGYPAGRVV
jgi:hypothetical protein